MARQEGVSGVMRARGLEIGAGAVAGLVGGLVVVSLQVWQGLAAPGILGVLPAGAGLALSLLLSTLAGAVFGGVFGYQPGNHGTMIGSGLLVGFLWWILRSLTIQQLVAGRGPTWSLADATIGFPFLVGDLLFGALLGLGLAVLVPLLLRTRPSWRTEAPRPSAPTRVVILGGGFGGVSTAQELERALPRSPDVEVTLVSNSNYLLFTPMLAEVASSALQPQHISVPLRAFAPSTTFRRAQVDGIDTDAQVVRLKAGPGVPSETLPYDHLVLALGAVPNYRKVPGVEQHAFALKTLDDATRLRNHVIGLLERADVEPDPEERRRQLTFVVAGGGFAGAELIAELFDLVHGVRRYYPNIQRERLRFVLVHSQDRILPELGAELADYALDKLRHKGIEFQLFTRLAGMTAESVLLDDGGQIPTRTLVWTAGNQPNPLMKTLPFKCTENGAIVCHSTLRVRSSANVWALGDCASVPNPADGGVPHPPTAQHALRQGKAVARNIAAVLHHRAPKPFRFQTLGMLVVLGHQQAAAEIRGVKFSGLVAWLMWRGIYLAKLPGVSKKIRVLLDWALDLFFPRDIVLTHVPGTPAHAELVAERNPERAA